MSLYQPSVEVLADVSQYCSLLDANANPILVVHSGMELVYANAVYNEQFGKDLSALNEHPQILELCEQTADEVLSSSNKQMVKDESTGVQFRPLSIQGNDFCVISFPQHAKLLFASSKRVKTNKVERNPADQQAIDRAVESAPHAVLVLDYDKNTYVAANEKAAKLLGYELDELVGTKLGDMSPGSAEGEGAQSVSKRKLKECVNTGKRVNFEWQVRKKDGTLIPCEISAFQIPTQNGVYIRSSIIDVSLTISIDEMLESQQMLFEDNVSKAIKKQQENQLKAFLRDSPIPVAMFDAEMNFLFAADEWLNKFPTEVDNIIGRNYYDVYGFVPMRWKLKHKQALKGQSSHMRRDHYMDSEGNKKWCRWDAKPWYLTEENIGGVIIYIQDITEEVVSESKMIDQERKYKHFFNSDSIGWVEISAPLLVQTIQSDKTLTFEKIAQTRRDVLGAVTRFNQKAADIFGIAADLEPESFEPLRFISEGIEDLAVNFFQAIRDKLDSFTCEVTIQNAYGETRYLSITIHFADVDGSGDLLYGIQDITDLKESVKALRDSEERYRTMFDRNSLAVVYTNYQKNMVKINESFTKIFGYTEEDMQTLQENDMLLPEYRDKNKAVFDAFKDGSKRFVSMEKEYLCKDGSHIYAQTSSSALYDESGLHYGNVTIIEDVTARKTSELQIRKQNEELIKINRELDQFVYSAAHDLRAPIANVMGLVKLIRMEEISAMASQYLDLQDKSLAKLDEFIKNIVDYSRNSRLDLTKDEIDLETFVTDVVDQYRFSENAERLDISIIVSQQDKFVSDENRLSVIMNNLVSNAIRYMDVEKELPYIKIEVEVTEDDASISVSDNGIGIEQKHLESIFDLFYRANSGSKGTGIGLYIVKETVDKLHGKISVNSEYGKGTNFTVTVKNFINEREA